MPLFWFAAGATDGRNAARRTRKAEAPSRDMKVSRTRATDRPGLAAMLVCVLAGCAASAAERQPGPALGEATPAGAPQATNDELAAEMPQRVRTFRVRVYADDAHRARIPDWQRYFDHTLEQFNRITERVFSVRLRVSDVRPWPRTGPGDLDQAIRELRELDPGADVDWVLGLTAPLAQKTLEQSKLGVAWPLDKYLVLRGLSAADYSTPEERFHKSISLFLHEWAHTLGALHTKEVQWIMHPRYAPQQTSLCARNTVLIRAALEHWGGAPSRRKRAAIFEDVARVAASPDLQWDGWVPGEFEDLARRLAEGPNTRESVDISDRLTPPDRAAYARAVALDRQGNVREAWRVLEALTERYDSEPTVVWLGCRVAAEAKQGGYPSGKLCAAASELVTGSAEPELTLVAIHRSRAQADLATLVDWLQRAHRKLDRLGESSSREWQSLARHYRDLDLMSSLARTLQNLAPGPLKQQLSRELNHARHTLGLPPNARRFGIRIVDEPEYLRQVQTALHAVTLADYRGAERAAASLLERFPGAPGPLVVQCDANLDRRRIARARKACDAALRAYEALSWGHFLRGSIALEQRDDRIAVEHFSRAIELDPALEAAYVGLANVLRRLDKRDELEDLAATHRAQFGRPLPNDPDVR